MTDCISYATIYVMTMIAHKLRFYPNPAQEAHLARMFGSARWVWNAALAWRTATYKLDGESATGVDFSRELTWLKTLDCYAWLKDTPATVYAQVLRDQDKAFANFFAGRAKYPKFKKRRVEQAIRMQMDQRTVMNCYRDGELLKIPGFGPVDVRWTRPINGVPKVVTVRRTAAGRYFVSFMVETAIATLPQRTNAVGIDMGLGDVIVTSDGVKSGRSRHFKRKEKALGRAQRRLSRKVKGSNRRRRAAREVAKIHAKIADSRADYLHKLSTQIIRDHQVIVIEDLSVKGMARGMLSKSVADAGLGELRRQLEYKAQWYGRELIVINRWEPTSKVCSACGVKAEAMPLSVRTWTCADCGTNHDRDHNAALNILMVGTAGRAGTATPKNAKARGEESSGVTALAAA